MDKDSRLEFSNSKDFEVKDFSNKPALSDIMMISRKTVVDGKNKMIPNISQNVLAGNNGIKLYFEIYSDSLTEYDIAFKITNKDGDLIHSSLAEQLLEDKLTKIYHEIDDLELGLGKYNLTIELMNKVGEILGSNTKEFRSRQRGLPLVIDDIDNVISQIVYIATPQEIDEIKTGENELEKTKRFFDFWKSKDPSPGNEENEVFEEYFARVAFANEKFGHYVAGWRTDRGMVFITLGAPNNIDRHPFDYENKPYEIWYYYELNRSFTFIDETGFGDYRLITPFYRDSFRYRY
jgi:GWxTD domain-containing protein